MVRLARLIRWAIVASGTRYASAICRVVSPPTARSVSATADGRRQRRVAAPEQEQQRVVALLGRAWSRLLVQRSSRARRADSERRASTSLRQATVISHARGLSGWSSGQWARPRATPPGRRPRPPRSRRRGGRGRRGPAGRGRAPAPRHGLSRHGSERSPGRSSRKGRTSIHSYSGSPPRPGAEDRNAAASWARSTLSTSITIQPAIRSLVSANGPSVTGALALAVEAHERALGRERLRVDELAALAQGVGHVVHERDVVVDLLRRPLVHRRAELGVRGRAAAVVLEQQVLRHDCLLRSVTPFSASSPQGRSRPGVLDIDGDTIAP